MSFGFTQVLLHRFFKGKRRDRRKGGTKEGENYTEGRQDGIQCPTILIINGDNGQLMCKQKYDEQKLASPTQHSKFEKYDEQNPL